jgi:hypothetical protein
MAWALDGSGGNEVQETTFVVPLKDRPGVEVTAGEPASPGTSVPVKAVEEKAIQAW